MISGIDQSQQELCCLDEIHIEKVLFSNVILEFSHSKGVNWFFILMFKKT